MPVTGTTPWKAQVTRLFLQGLGFEDIAVRMGESPDRIRREFKEREAENPVAYRALLDNARARWLRQSKNKWWGRK